MSIDLTSKATVRAYIDTLVIEAGQFLGHLQIGAPRPSDPSIRPYTCDRLPAAVAKDKKSTSILSRINLVASIVAAFHLRSQASYAKEQLDISEKYHSASLMLNGGYHERLTTQLKDHPLAQISDKIFQLALKVKEMDERRKREVTNYKNCGELGILGVVVLSIGVYASNRWLKAVAGVILLASGVLFSYTKIAHRGDAKKMGEDYLTIGQQGEKIRKDLCFYNGDMTLKVGPGENYQPLFVDFVDATYNPTPLTMDELGGITYPVAALAK